MANEISGAHTGISTERIIDLDEASSQADGHAARINAETVPAFDDPDDEDEEEDED